jgi:lipopolysaccharide biosynthesis protein
VAGEAGKARLVAFYLPQFHPIPENDQWWGRGFTEWTNVSKARPLFRDHYQPHLPADLGFYDLRLPETRMAQANLARDHGIEGFCYWHYWFDGRRLLERPFHEVLTSGQPDFPFCLAWANETWSRRWLGEERDILLKQSYSDDDDTRHAQWLVTAFADRRYMKVGQRAVFLIYRPRDLPEPRRTIERIRTAALKRGLADPYLIGIDAHCPGVDCRAFGFDATLAFEPQLGALPDYNHEQRTLQRLKRNLKFRVVSPTLKIYDYVDARSRMAGIGRAGLAHPCLFVGWDNTPRRGRKGVVIVNSTPRDLEVGLQDLIERVQPRPVDERFVFLNAWNEWAEGNHLEPDLKHGRRFLGAIRRAASGGP